MDKLALSCNHGGCDIYIVSFFKNVPILYKSLQYRTREKKALLKDSVFAQTIEKTMGHSLIKGNSLDSFLILPVQRVPRYVMLLQDLIKNTEPLHPDYAWLEKSLESMKAVATFINDAILDEERRINCIEVSKQLVFQPNINIKWTPSNRLLINQGIVNKQCHNKIVERELFLFNDTLMYSRVQTNKTYNVMGLTELEKVEVESYPDKPEDKIVNAFVIKAPKKSFYCYANSAADKEKWVTLITRAIGSRREAVQTRLSFTTGEVLGASVTAAVWDADKSSGSCTLCGNEFTFLHRRHHCRKCGRLVDAECSNQKIKIPGITEKSVRVCTNCYNEFK